MSECFTGQWTLLDAAKENEASPFYCMNKGAYERNANGPWPLVRKVLHWQWSLSVLLRKKEIQTCWTTTSLHQLSGQTATVPFPNLPGFQQNTAQLPMVAPAMTLMRPLTDKLAVAVKGITAPNPSFWPSAKGFRLRRNVPRRTYSECNLRHQMEVA